MAKGGGGGGGGGRGGGGRRGRRGKGSPLRVASLIVTLLTFCRRFATDFIKHATFPPLSSSPGISLLSSGLYTAHILCIRRSSTELQKKKERKLTNISAFLSVSSHPPLLHSNFPPHPDCPLKLSLHPLLSPGEGGARGWRGEEGRGGEVWPPSSSHFK